MRKDKSDYLAISGWLDCRLTILGEERSSLCDRFNLGAVFISGIPDDIWHKDLIRFGAEETAIVFFAIPLAV